MLFQLYSDLSQEQKSKALELLPVSVRHFSDIIEGWPGFMKNSPKIGLLF